ncbi:hypothetical protein CCAX7_64030 [Capsulimonas corticalis]|uniref:Uncharacterized protein n=1 Tax=Capsulimonas corticalis TaxID=2219043 RepID=A0A402CQQ8_9BACT|nr:hypothetical protein CCAX7_64030 [Capsulimonas corticalis]
MEDCLTIVAVDAKKTNDVARIIDRFGIDKVRASCDPQIFNNKRVSKKGRNREQRNKANSSTRD